MNKWSQLLSQEEGSALVQAESLGLPPAGRTARIDVRGTTCYNYYADGVSITCIDGKVDSVDFYFVSNVYTRCTKVLPLGIQADFTGKKLLQMFGEPLEKGGGLKAGINVWLRWRNFQGEIDTKSWDRAADSKMASLTIFAT